MEIFCHPLEAWMGTQSCWKAPYAPSFISKLQRWEFAGVWPTFQETSYGKEEKRRKKNEMISRQRDAEIKALGLLLRQLFLAVVTVNIEGRTSSACECYVCREHISRNDYRARAWGLRPSFWHRGTREGSDTSCLLDSGASPSTWSPSCSVEHALLHPPLWLTSPADLWSVSLSFVFFLSSFQVIQLDSPHLLISKRIIIGLISSPSLRV